ncbi:hypothetical protein X773_33180 [Mesorhizobium sp. LSJC285A00]|nr:hypothetical protein X771_31165 [Mesorhizobium sp. LSJC277A00]ESW64068.1 hypothetical protein X773_33180 [Mesorhizobium sp. LSJC285A00]
MVAGQENEQALVRKYLATAQGGVLKPVREDDVEAPAAYSRQALFEWNVFDLDAHVWM